jgi:small-conductance mechanosensitive channel
MNLLNETIVTWWNDPLIKRSLTLVFGFSIILIIRFFVKRTLNKSIKSTDSKYRARKALNFTVYLLMILVVIIVFNDKINNLGVALGMVGAGIAFALQEVIMSIAGWINILTAGTISIGQRVKIGNIKGDVIDIGVFSTTLMEVGEWVDGDLYNGRIAIITNSFVFKDEVHKYSGEYPFLWDEIYIPIRLESDYKEARILFTNILTEVCGEYAKKSQAQWTHLTNKYRVEEARVLPMVTLRFDQNWITFTLRYIVDYKQRRSTKDIIYTRVLDAIKEQKGRIRIASSAMEVTEIRESPEN